jgi:hypothetical protein
MAHQSSTVSIARSMNTTPLTSVRRASTTISATTWPAIAHSASGSVLTSRVARVCASSPSNCTVKRCCAPRNVALPKGVRWRWQVWCAHPQARPAHSPASRDSRAVPVAALPAESIPKGDARCAGGDGAGLQLQHWSLHGPTSIVVHEMFNSALHPVRGLAPIAQIEHETGIAYGQTAKGCRCHAGTG